MKSSFHDYYWGMLNSISHGSPTDKTPAFIAHGLYGSARNWGVIVKRLSDERQVTAVDMRNHGSSPWYDSHTYADMAGDLLQVIEQPRHLIGHSMGGKAAMVAALTHPDKVKRLVVADIAPVAYAHTQQPMIDAMRRVDLARVEKRSDALAQLSEIDAGVATFLTQSLDIKRKKWTLNLDTLEAEMDKIIGFPAITAQFNGPTLFLTGADSDYVLPTHRPRIKELFPNARFAKIKDAGHWLHADQPRAFEATVRQFLTD